MPAFASTCPAPAPRPPRARPARAPRPPPSARPSPRATLTPPAPPSRPPPAPLPAARFGWAAGRRAAVRARATGFGRRRARAAGGVAAACRAQVPRSTFPPSRLPTAAPILPLRRPCAQIQHVVPRFSTMPTYGEALVSHSLTGGRIPGFITAKMQRLPVKVLKSAAKWDKLQHIGRAARNQ